MDYYATLGVTRFASQEAIKRAFRSRIRAVHPDLNLENGVATDQARRVIEAYHILHDPDSRRLYDRSMPTAAHVLTPYRYRDIGFPIWLTRIFLIGLLFVVSSGAFFTVLNACADSTPIPRPYLGAINTPTDPASPALFAKADTSQSHIAGLSLINKVPDIGNYNVPAGH